MTDPYTVPAEMRDFADRSVQQARKAFEGFMGAVKKSTGAMESASTANFTGASTKAVAIAEKNVTAAFDLAEKLVHAKDIQEVMAIQAEYMKAQMAAVQEQTREFGEAFAKSMTPGSK